MQRMLCARPRLRRASDRNRKKPFAEMVAHPLMECLGMAHRERAGISVGGNATDALREAQIAQGLRSESKKAFRRNGCASIDGMSWDRAPGTRGHKRRRQCNGCFARGPDCAGPQIGIEKSLSPKWLRIH